MFGDLRSRERNSGHGCTRMNTDSKQERYRRYLCPSVCIRGSSRFFLQLLKMRLLLTGVVLAAGMPAQAQDRRSRIDVEQYTIDAEISPNTQSLTAKAALRPLP